MTMVKIKIDGKEYEVKKGKNLLEATLGLGMNVPHFCYHPAMGSVGACRLCAVRKYRDEDDKQGRIVMSCLEPVTEGMIVSIHDVQSTDFRSTVVESLMTNHPHDCPVCDEGGECHLQDMTVMTGHNYRRFEYKKRTHKNQYLGPFIAHEMNRCIQCYRCVRFYKDYAGGKDLNSFASHNHVYFGRHEEGTLESEFSGNLVEVCPTGVFTDKTFHKHYNRKWDLSNAPSVCTGCSVGCNIIVSERYGSLRRVMNRYNGAVNGYFICDRGRFGYEFVNDKKRIKTIKVRSEKVNTQEDVEKESLILFLKEALSKDKKVIGIGSPRASLESNFALSTLVGNENFYQGISQKEQRLTQTVLNFLKQSNVRIPSLKQMEKADAVVVLGEDLVNTAPMVALALRQATRNKSFEEAEKNGIPQWNDAPLRELAQDERSPMFVVTPFKDSLDEIAEDKVRASYPEIANLGFAVAAMLDEKAPTSINLNKEHQKLAEKIASTLKNAKNPLIVSGIHSGDEGIARAAMNLAQALKSVNKNCQLSMILPESNSMGLAMMPGKSLDELLIKEREIDTLVVLENDLYRRASAKSISALFEKSKKVIVLDHLMNQTAQRADVLLPAATFAEAEGTLVNQEGRAQRFYKALTDKEPVAESWRWIGEMVQAMEQKQHVPWKHFDNVVESMARELPVFEKLVTYMPNADFRMLSEKVPRQTLRYSGRTSMNAKVAVSEARVAQDEDSPLAFSMEGQQEKPASSLTSFYWTPGWNSVQALYGYMDEPNGSMKGGDPGIRLIEPVEESKTEYFKVLPEVENHENEWQIVPVYQIFGSEELSVVSTALAKRIKEPFIYLNPEDAKSKDLNDGDMVELETSETKLKIKVRIENSVQKGLAGLAKDLPGMPFVALPDYGRFEKINS